MGTESGNKAQRHHGTRGLAARGPSSCSIETPMRFMGPLLVAMIIAAGPGLAAVQADLAEQTDSAMRRRHPQTNPESKNRSDNLPDSEKPKDTSASFVATAPVKPADTKSSAGPLALTVHSTANLVLMAQPSGLSVRDALPSPFQLHRPIYCAHAPPVDV